MVNGKNFTKWKTNKFYITLECMLEFEKKEDKEKVLDLMRRFSSALRYAYKRLLEGISEKEIEKAIKEKHKLNAKVCEGYCLNSRKYSKLLYTKRTKPKKACIWFKGTV